MNFITAILTAICQLFIAFTQPLRGLFRSRVHEKKAADPRLRKKIIMGVSILVIIGSLASIIISIMPARRYKINRSLFVGLGQALADETAKAVSKQGQVVVVVSPDYLIKGTPPAIQLGAFQSELKKFSGIKIIATESVPLQETNPDQNLPRDQFDKITAKFDKSSAIVSFIGLPTLEPEHPLTLPTAGPKIIAIYTSSPSVKDYFAKSIATSLIIPRKQISSQQSPPQTPRESFDRYYQAATINNYEALPD